MNGEVRLKEVMTEGVKAIDADSNIVEAARKLREEDVRGLVVIEEGEAVGVVVCRDITYDVTADGESARNTKVSDIMSTDLIVAEEDEVLDDTAMAMAKNKISRVPVVRGDMLVGIVTQSDILRAWPGFAEVMKEEGDLE